MATSGWLGEFLASEEEASNSCETLKPQVCHYFSWLKSKAVKAKSYQTVCFHRTNNIPVYNIFIDQALNLMIFMAVCFSDVGTLRYSWPARLGDRWSHTHEIQTAPARSRYQKSYLTWRWSLSTTAYCNKGLLIAGAAPFLNYSCWKLTLKSNLIVSLRRALFYV